MVIEKVGDLLNNMKELSPSSLAFKLQTDILAVHYFTKLFLLSSIHLLRRPLNSATEILGQIDRNAREHMLDPTLHKPR